MVYRQKIYHIQRSVEALAAPDRIVGLKIVVIGIRGRMKKKDLHELSGAQAKECELYLKSEFPTHEIEFIRHQQNWLWLLYAVRSIDRTYYVAFSRDFLDQAPTAILQRLVNLNLAEILRQSESEQKVFLTRNDIKYYPVKAIMPPSLKR